MQDVLFISRRSRRLFPADPADYFADHADESSEILYLIRDQSAKSAGNSIFIFPADHADYFADHADEFSGILSFIRDQSAKSAHKICEICGKQKS